MPKGYKILIVGIGALVALHDFIITRNAQVFNELRADHIRLADDVDEINNRKRASFN